MLRLHFHPLSPYSRKAWVALLHRRDSFEPVQLDLGTGALRRPEFLAISPFGRMPVLETDAGPIIESTSIVEWLESRGPRVLIPEDSDGAFAARHFDRIGDLYLTAPMATLWWEPRTEAAAEAPSVAAKAWRLFAARLQDRPFVAGSGFTFGDLGAAIATDYLERMGVQPPPAVAAWRARCFEVPAMAQALGQAMPFIEPTLARRAAGLASA